MDELLTKLLEFLKSISDRSGVKFLIALAGIGSLWHLVSIDKIQGLHGGIGILLVTVGFFVIRHFETINGGTK